VLAVTPTPVKPPSTRCAPGLSCDGWSHDIAARVGRTCEGRGADDALNRTDEVPR
jgi:hypothetical protein